MKEYLLAIAVLLQKGMTVLFEKIHEILILIWLISYKKNSFVSII